jgi:beta-lysine 5,6-aminomutase alpha subunit
LAITQRQLQKGLRPACLGIDGVDKADVPLANVMVEKLEQAGIIDRGLVPWLARAVVARNESPQEIAEALASGEISVQSVPDCPAEQWREKADTLAVEAAAKIRAVRS